MSTNYKAVVQRDGAWAVLDQSTRVYYSQGEPRRYCEEKARELNDEDDKAKFEKSQIAMFGCKRDDLIESVEQSLTFTDIGVGMVIMSVLSDAQEMGGNDKQEVRQAINRAKFLISHYKIGLIGETE